MVEHLHRNEAKHDVGPFRMLHTVVRCELAEIRDYTDEARIHEALILHWEAHTRIPVPAMRGMITVRPNGPYTELRMEGWYTPPLGVFGRVFDTVIGMRLAQRTIDRFLEELSSFVEHEWETERLRNPFQNGVGTTK